MGREWDYPAMPKAKVGSETCECPWKRDWQVKMQPLEKSNKIWTVEGSRSVGVTGISVELAPGHTPGHQIVVIDAGKGQKAYYIGDLLVTTAQIANPEFDSAFDCCQWPDD